MKKIVYITFILSSLIYSCKKELTSWSSNWGIPLVNDTLNLKNLVADSFLGTNGSGFYQLEINRNLVDINLSDYIEIPDTIVTQKYAIGINNISVSPGTSFVNNNKDHKFDLKDVQLKKARLSAGLIKITVSNPIQTGTIFSVKLPGVKKNGEVIEKTFQTPAGTILNPSTISTSIDLNGYEIDLRGTGGAGFNLLQSEMKVQTDPQGNTVNITNQDSTKFSVEISGLKFDYAQGYFGSLSVEDSTSLVVDFLNKITGGNIDLNTTNIEFIVSNGIKVSARANLMEIKNIHPVNGMVSLTHPQLGTPFMLDGALGSWNSFSPFVKKIQFTSSNSNIENFIENLGSTIKLKYKLELNPYGNISGGWDEFYPTSKLSVFLKANMPLSAQFNNFTITDTFDIKIEQNQEKGHITNGQLKLKAKNAFPIKGNIIISFLDEYNNLIGSTSGNQPVQSSIQGTMDNGIMVSNSTMLIDVPASIISRINEVTKVVVSLKADTPNSTNTGNQMVFIPDGAFFKIQLNANFTYKNQY
jgi:hypothetical protein